MAASARAPMPRDTRSSTPPVDLNPNRVDA
jgi:hypothetical protein